jgi:hypothetical protein
MTIEALYVQLADLRLPIAVLVFAAPWITYLLCVAIPGKTEEPLLLSINLGLAIAGFLLLIGYLSYAVNIGGWRLVVTTADLLLLVLPLYHMLVSLWLSRRRLPLHLIPAFRTFQGLIMMAAAFLFLSWLGARIRIIFFSFVPFSTFLVLLAIVVGIGYAGYRKITD